MAPIIHPVRAFTASLVALLVAVAITPLFAVAQTPRGNELNPAGDAFSSAFDERGMSQWRATRRRSPSGWLYPYPTRPAPAQDLGEGWQYRGLLELGTFWDGGDEGETRFERFAEWRDQSFASAFGLELFNRERGWYSEVSAGALGREDEFYRLLIEKAGSFSLKGSFDRVPHRYASDARVLFNRPGSDSLELVGGLVPGANTGPALDAALATLGERNLEVRRERSALSLEYFLSEQSRISASYRYDNRRGGKPFGAGFSFPPSVGLSGAVEVVEPIDDATHRAELAFRYASQTLQWTLGYDGSLYHNRDPALTFENPVEVLGGGPTIERGRFALMPDNQAHRVHGELGMALPGDSRLVVTGSWQRLLQDEDLLPPTVNNVIIGFGANTVDLADWNTRAALEQRSADAQIDQLVLGATWSARLTKALRAKLRLRFRDQDNDTRYTAFNPVTGQFGYIAEDGGHGAISALQSGVAFAGVNTRVRNTPYETQRRSAEADFAYRLSSRTTLALKAERRELRRPYRERERTRENRAKLTLTTRELAKFTIRADAAWMNRDGSRVDPSALARFYSEGAAPPYLPGLQRPDIADLDRREGKLRVHALLSETMDVALTAQYRHDDFDNDFGITNRATAFANLEWNYQPTPNLDVYVFASGEHQVRDLKSSLGFVGVPTFFDVARWRVDSEQSGYAFGAGGETRRGRVRLRGDYQFGFSRETLDYDFVNPAVVAGGALPANDRFPQLVTRDHTLQTSLLIALNEVVELHLYYRFRRSTLRDFRQENLFLRDGNRVFFGHEDDSFQASVYGVAARLRF